MRRGHKDLFLQQPTETDPKREAFDSCLSKHTIVIFFFFKQVNSIHESVCTVECFQCTTS